MQNKYGQIDARLRIIRSSGQNDVRIGAIKSSGEEFQTNHFHPKATNIGDKFQTGKLGIKNQGQTKQKAKTEEVYHMHTSIL